MFRNTSTASEPASVEMRPIDELIPLSYLSLDVDEPNVGWDIYLTGRGIPIVLDHVGRSAISTAAVKQLLDEKRESEARAREVAARNEQQAIEADQQWRATLNKGVEWWRLPNNTSPGDAMALAAAQANARKSVQQELMEQEFGGGPQNSMVYQPWPQDEAS